MSILFKYLLAVSILAVSFLSLAQQTTPEEMKTSYTQIHKESHRHDIKIEADKVKEEVKKEVDEVKKEVDKLENKK